MRRQGIEDLVRDHDADDRGGGVGCSRCIRHAFGTHAGVAGLRQAGLDRLDPRRFDLDRVVPDHGREIGLVIPEGVQDGQRQRAGAGAVFAKDERGGPAQPPPGIADEPGQRPAEDRMRLGRGEEVAFPAGSAHGTAVVAAAGVVQGE
jgi:hypothetical protein